MLFKPALLSHSMKWQKAGFQLSASIMISNQAQQLLHETMVKKYPPERRALFKKLVFVYRAS
jgi:hypothetical protein